LAKPPYLLWLALAAFVVGCAVLVRVQSAPALDPEKMAGKDCWFSARGLKLFRGEQRCYLTLPQRRICGVWMPGFEQSLFLHDIKDLSDVGSVSYGDLPWLDAAGDARGLSSARDGAAYQLCFLGREANYFGVYGHFGASRTGVFVEKVESMREIQVPKDLRIFVPGSSN
jgi:hypothetical protein